MPPSPTLQLDLSSQSHFLPSLIPSSFNRFHYLPQLFESLLLDGGGIALTDLFPHILPQLQAVGPVTPVLYHGARLASTVFFSAFPTLIDGLTD